MRIHFVDKLLEQHCYKSAASLLQLVRFYMCTTHVKTKTSCYRSANKLLQICSQAVDKLCPHYLFPVLVTSLEQAVNNLYQA